jgi:hypothetical protein
MAEWMNRTHMVLRRFCRECVTKLVPPPMSVTAQWTTGTDLAPKPDVTRLARISGPHRPPTRFFETRPVTSRSLALDPKSAWGLGSIFYGIFASDLPKPRPQNFFVYTPNSMQICINSSDILFQSKKIMYTPDQCKSRTELDREMDGRSGSLATGDNRLSSSRWRIAEDIILKWESWQQRASGTPAQSGNGWTDPSFPI